MEATCFMLVYNLFMLLMYYPTCQVPRTSKGTAFEMSEESQGDSSPAGLWQNIIEYLNRLLCTLKENFVCNLQF